ncbi:MAG TPA: response regulator [Opitutaceae bacterium]|jgi:two-component system KDP operon response regulator KdpE
MSFERKFDVLVVDDEERVRKLLALALTGEKFGVREAESGRVALGEVTLRQPDIIVLDLELPDIGGIEVIAALRQFSSVPVLVLTDLGDERVKMAALNAGADDCMTKPCGGGELVARVRAILRRTQQPAASAAVFKFGPLEVDLEKSRVLRSGRQVKLTTMEFKLLKMLVLNRDKVLTHEFILSGIWGPNATHHTNYLRIYMMHLRRKLGEDADSAGHFQTESGVGYRFVSDPLLSA